jgi:serine/threonine protein kinase
MNSTKNKNTHPDPDKNDQNLTYTATQIIGKGSFGVVYKAMICETGEIVAIKKVFQDTRYKNREFQIIKELHHPNTIELRHAFYSPGDRPEEQYLNVVMDYIPESLSKTIRNVYNTKQQIPLILLKLYSYQMLRSLAYIHAIGICHRDIKPDNILVNPQTNVLKLCDFGSAKKLVAGEPNVSYICSRYYRAPELIFGATEYTTAIDVWSTGCVIAEIVLGQPLFPGDSAVDQIVEIIKILGTPNKSQIQAMNPEYTEYRFPIIKPYPWTKVFKTKTLPDNFYDLIGQLLVYEPHIRAKAIKILAHPFFDELRDQNTVLPNGMPLPPLFNFGNEEKGEECEFVEKYLIPKWYKESSQQ